tara:strand:+ start:1146 stop:1463 length:318 start_codon:yes stop_codon:yes gene_type:complete
MTSVMSPYLMSKRNRFSRRTVSQLTGPRPTNMSNFDSASMMEPDTEIAKRMLDDDSQGGYFVDKRKKSQAESFNNVANVQRAGRTGSGVVGYNNVMPSARIERRR